MDCFSDEFERAAGSDETLSLMVAEGFAVLNEKEKALDWLENAVWRGVMNHSFLATQDPFLESLRGEERFKRLMGRINHERDHAAS